MPVADTGVLSTQISELQREAVPERADDTGVRRDVQRLLLPSAAILILACVVAVGLMLFNRDLLNRAFPPPAPPAKITPAIAPSWEPEWCWVPAGHYPPVDPDPLEQGFFISRYEVTNTLWSEFLDGAEEHLRTLELWADANPGPDAAWGEDDSGRPVLPEDQRSHPVRNISAEVAAEFCAWLTRRLKDPAWEIRLPTNVEWEVAARGAEGRLYPWGDEFAPPAAPKTGRNRPPSAIYRPTPLPVDQVFDDVSPANVSAMGTNVCEWTIWWAQSVSTLRESLAEGGFAGQRAFKRGASFAHSTSLARRDALASDRRPADAKLRSNNTGVRLVKVSVRAPE